MIIKYDLAWV